MLSTISANLPYLLLVFAREIGLFLFSPLFLQRGIPLFLRISLVFIIALVLFPHLPSYNMSLSLPWFYVIQELVIGYLLGTLFSFALEAAIAAGRWFGTTAGFSSTELLDPFQNQKNPLFVTFFTLLTLAFIFACDLHHLFLYFLFDSYHIIPLQTATIERESLYTLTQSGQLLFSLGIQYILYPLFLLWALLLFFMLLTKFYPEIPLFWLGLSLQLLLGFIALSLLMIFILPLIQRGFMEILYLTIRVFV